MKFLKIALVVFVILLAPTIANATPLDYYETRVLVDSEKSKFTMIFLFEEAPSGSLEYPLPFNIKDFESSANFRNYTCNYVEKTWGTLINCDFSHVKEGGRVLNIKFSTNDAVKKIENKFLFSSNIKTPQNVKKMILKVILEKGYVLIEEPEKPTTLVPYSPRDGLEGSDGRRIFIEWKREDVEKGEGIDVSVTYEFVKPIKNDQNLIFLIIGILILIITVILGTRNKSVDTSILKDDERKVLDIIRERGGMCKQRVIVRETDFSKAKVSRLIKDLEERGLITTEKSGRSKKVYIKSESD